MSSSHFWGPTISSCGSSSKVDSHPASWTSLFAGQDGWWMDAQDGTRRMEQLFNSMNDTTLGPFRLVIKTLSAQRNTVLRQWSSSSNCQNSFPQLLKPSPTPSSPNTLCSPINQTSFTGQEYSRKLVAQGSTMLTSVLKSLVRDHQDLPNVHLMYQSQQKKFQTVSCATHMNIWFSFMSFNIDPAPTAGIAAHLKDLYTNLKSINFSMFSNTFLGFVLQATIISSDAGFKASTTKNQPLSPFSSCLISVISNMCFNPLFLQLQPKIRQHIPFSCKSPKKV
ncbi:hypothetical protein VP01_1597g4 [Puccinia sorghi]|uniref:Uncharacterized protein n=1 Tax=Puccinia sorghi TaxID=27349 RepID=A0A0L6VHZ7_9BASI|nr:hypothetical protein VP01_1597g4 [Puccinia sorghi]